MRLEIRSVMAGKVEERKHERQIITVRVQPKSRQQQLIQLSATEFKARLKAAPDRGQANAELLALLADYLGLPPSRLTIIQGKTARTKLIEIKNTATPEKTS
ncbi:MAG TPA: DUF167 family protein [Candidatus Saccharicenans sp.]|nr:DUF167 domain-containing protein [Acidobacteriota bacterium]HPP23665.1 DUF167 family protein [Candidatus Saccharicenans sp.]